MRKNVLLMIVMVLLLSACSGGKKEQQAENQVRPTDVTVTKVVLSNIDDFLYSAGYCRSMG